MRIVDKITTTVRIDLASQPALSLFPPSVEVHALTFVGQPTRFTMWTGKESGHSVEKRWVDLGLPIGVLRTKGPSKTIDQIPLPMTCSNVPSIHVETVAIKNPIGWR